MANANTNSTAAADTRLHPRYPAGNISGITSVRLSPGDVVTLVNLSASGILVEGKTRFVPGTRLTVNFEGPAALAPAKGRVVRCQVSAIGEGGSLQYQSAIAFDEAIDVPVGRSGGCVRVTSSRCAKADEPAGTARPPAAKPLVALAAPRPPCRRRSA